MSVAKWCIGIDLGGSFIKCCLGCRDGATMPILQRPTPADGGADAVVEAMAAAGRAALDRHGIDRGQVAGVGIGSPGPLDYERGVVVSMPNIPGMELVPLRDRLAEAMGVPAYLENDANAAAYGEYIAGAGSDVDQMVLLTLGTGIGSGVIRRGRILHGAHGIGGEAGHMIVQPGGDLCGCGQRGCLERYSSATYIARRARMLIETGGRASSLAGVIRAKGDIDARHVNEARKAGDPLAVEVWGQAMTALAVGCVNICRLFDPDAIVLAGGLTGAGEDLTAPLLAEFNKLHWTLAEPKTRILLAALGGEAGAIGAANLALREFC